MTAQYRPSSAASRSAAMALNARPSSPTSSRERAVTRWERSPSDNRSAAAAVPRAHSAAPVAGHKIVVDPGHGGEDLGSTACPGLLEKDANLDIALRLKTVLIENGATVYMTREQDVDMSSKERAAYIEGRRTPNCWSTCT